MIPSFRLFLDNVLQGSESRHADPFDACLKLVLEKEGGFVNHPEDPGGATNMGITKATYERWVGHPVSVNTIRSLTREQVAPIYRKFYWEPLKCDRLPPGVQLCVFDMGVNAGPNRAAKMLQECVGSDADGFIGPLTLAAVRSHVDQFGAEFLVHAYSRRRREFYASLGHFGTFGRGWLNRTNSIEDSANQMIRRWA